ncbi:MAG: M20/M25/M40 family metallo-hydrolase [Acidobacteria bacterium]|nr:M20/M25/M40 family metallo-hydrolase [Acidobacteriota bacterium]
MSRGERWLVTVCGLVPILVLASPFVAAQPVDQATLAAIRAEGLARSQVMDHISWLSDVYGPRVTGTPAIEDARRWATQQLQAWRLSNVHEERFAFGQGWSLRRFHAHMTAPQVMPLIGYPKSWSSSTAGTVTAEVVRTDIRTPADLDTYRGRLHGKIVLPQPARDVPLLEGDVVLRMSDAQLGEAAQRPLPPVAVESRPDQGPSFEPLLQQFYLTEGVVAVLDRGIEEVMMDAGSELPYQTQRTDGGTIFVGRGGSRHEDAGSLVPAVTLAVEHYNRMVRILDKGLSVEVELLVDAEFHPETTAADGMNAFNLLAEIPGTDRADEVVMIGAHFDTTHASTGATDNAAGVAAMMEAMRLLQVVGARPRRTIRLALWGAEEQGLLGSGEYVRRHFGDRATMTLTPAHETLSAYFNLDNGAGRLRGLWLQDNDAVAPIFEDWLPSLSDLGVTTLGPRRVSGTDHVPFDAIGLPAFQFMQDRLEYNSRTHHSNMDVVDRVPPDDVIQMAIVAATFAYNTAMRDERLPRKPLPRVEP